MRHKPQFMSEGREQAISQVPQSGRPAKPSALSPVTCPLRTGMTAPFGAVLRHKKEEDLSDLPLSINSGADLALVNKPADLHDLRKTQIGSLAVPRNPPHQRLRCAFSGPG